MATTKKRLKPSQRERKRYIVFQIRPADFSFDDVKNAIIEACTRFLGEFGVAKANVYVIKNLYQRNGRGVLRAANKMVNDVKAALVKISRINKTAVTCRTLGISGTLKKAKRKFLLKE
jgi:ribonuclease P/MRP protein subunit POP5